VHFNDVIKPFYIAYYTKYPAVLQNSGKATCNYLYNFFFGNMLVKNFTLVKLKKIMQVETIIRSQNLIHNLKNK